MPESIFKQYLLELGASINSIERLANIFRVSIQASARRIAEVSSEPCITLIWQHLLRTKVIRLAWCVGPGKKSIGKVYYTPSHTRIRPPSTLHKAYEQDHPVKCYSDFKVGNEVKKRLPMEAKGFGRGEKRYVVSLAFPER